MTDLDPKLTFDSFVVGPANRLASAAARRAAESPGASYNPLFVYSASGLGKTHILTAVAHHARRNGTGGSVRYLTLERYLEELASTLERGERDAFRSHLADLDVLLLDDVQFLTGQPEAQEMLLRTLDRLSASGSQIVLASDRPPAEIDGLDARLLSRFSGGLIVDIAPPEFETRVAIIRRKAEERGHELGKGVAEAIARVPLRNVRELGGALNKVFATQDLEGRPVSVEEIVGLLGEREASRDEDPGGGEFDSFLQDVTHSLAERVQADEEPWRTAFRETVDAAEREGFVADRLRAYQGREEPEDWTGILDCFNAALERLREIERALDRLRNPWPEAARGILRDPDRLDEAETLLTSVEERQRPFPRLGPGPLLDELEGFAAIAMNAARQLVRADKPEYHPLYLWSGEPGRVHALLAAAGRSHARLHPRARVAVTSAAAFAEDFIRALGAGVAGAWRERWWTLDLLMVHGLEVLSETERAQDEFFHLFEALKRRGARVLLAADRPPSGIGEIDERLRSRFEGGLVLEVEEGEGIEEIGLVDPAEEPLPDPAAGLWGEEVEDAPGPEEEPGDDGGDSAAPARGAAGVAGSGPEGAGGPDPAVPEDSPSASGDVAWLPSREKVVLHWPELERLVVEELD
jgi:chromosomal replication initiation ATPase DnaA